MTIPQPIVAAPTTSTGREKWQCPHCKTDFYVTVDSYDNEVMDDDGYAEHFLNGECELSMVLKGETSDS